VGSTGRESTRLLVNAAKRSYSKKYLTRPSPALSATIAYAKGVATMQGNDGKTYRIQVLRSGKARWVRA
jgi:hypothetical protein